MTRFWPILSSRAEQGRYRLARRAIVLIISHHDDSAFERYADKMYEFIPTAEGVLVKERVSMPTVPDEEA